MLAFSQSPLGGHRCTPSLSAFTAGSTHKIQYSMKMGGPKIPKGQLSRVPLPGISAKPLVFQQPHQHSYTLYLAILTQTEYHYIR